MSLKSRNNDRSSTSTQPISLRLVPADIERLQARAHVLSEPCLAWLVAQCR